MRLIAFDVPASVTLGGCLLTHILLSDASKVDRFR